MNLSKLFQIQRVLDDRILENKGLIGQDLLPMKILALQVELGELANEARFFKFWSEDRKPRTQVLLDCTVCDGTGDLNHEMVQEEAEGNGGHEYFDCEDCGATGKGDFTNPLLEEYADCLSFILSIGLDLKMDDEGFLIECDYTEENATDTFIEMFDSVSALKSNTKHSDRWDLCLAYYRTINLFIGLGEKFLDFTVEQIEESYYAKNQINHERQATGY